MENNQNLPEKLDFVSFIRTYFDYYKIDANNKDVVEQISLWASGDVKFEKRDGQFLRKGIWLIGPVGTGKTDLFYCLSKYLGPYLNTRYAFRKETAWKFTNEFSKNGYEALDGQDRGNAYYDELCLLNSKTQWPDKEEAVHFGKKVLIGEELISLRYECFKYQGYRTHFSSNTTEAKTQEVYGDRAYDRLREMCNVFILLGASRRGGEGHVFEDKNKPKPPAPREVSVDYEAENKQILEQHYIDFLEGKQPSTNMALMYNILSSYGVKVASEDELRELMADIVKSYTSEVPLIRITPSEKEKIKNEWVWEQSRKAAVGIFFSKMKAGGATSIFGVKNVGDINLPAFKG